ncbi:MAG: hypothetical protein ACOYM0_04840 [Bacteroidales bacterium]
MKTKILFPVYGLIILIFVGCAVGRKIPYEKMKVNLSFSGSQSIALAVYDQREMVVDGSRKPDFVGYCRSGVGIAYPIGTESGKSFAEIIQETISRAFSNTGYSVKLVQTSYRDSFEEIKGKLIATSANRLIIIKLNKCYSDFYNANIFHYNVDLTIYDKKGSSLITKNFVKDDNIGGGTWGQGKYKEYSPVYLEKEIESWLNNPEISAKLK